MTEEKTVFMMNMNVNRFYHKDKDNEAVLMIHICTYIVKFRTLPTYKK